MATWAIGDIQGCMASLECLLEKIAWRPGHDSLWLVGDLVNRGPRSLDVLRWAKQHERDVIAVLGNHDLHLLACAAGVTTKKKRDTLDDILAAVDRDALCSWLSARPLLVAVPGFVMVHAGIPPSWSLAETQRRARSAELALAGPRRNEILSGLVACAESDTISALTRLRACTPDGALSHFDGPPNDVPPGTRPWWEYDHPHMPTIVHGHWSAAGLAVTERRIGLDTGCVWGRQLTAVRLEDRHVVQVSAQE